MSQNWYSDLLALRTTSDQTNGRVTEVSMLKAEVAWQSVRATAAEEALQEALNKVALLNGQHEGHVLVSRVTELEAALATEKSLCQRYKNELEQERRRVAELEVLLRKRSFPVHTPSEAGVSSECSVSEGSPEADSVHRESMDDAIKGNGSMRGPSVRAELEMLREENASRTTQYVRAAARSAALEKKAKRLEEMMQDQARCIAGQEAAITRQHMEMLEQKQELQRREKEADEIQRLLMKVQAQRTQAAENRTRCFTWEPADNAQEDFPALTWQRRGTDAERSTTPGPFVTTASQTATHRNRRHSAQLQDEDSDEALTLVVFLKASDDEAF